jgi:hypothetical protein
MPPNDRGIHQLKCDSFPQYNRPALGDVSIYDFGVQVYSCRHMYRILYIIEYEIVSACALIVARVDNVDLQVWLAQMVLQALQRCRRKRQAVSKLD